MRESREMSRTGARIWVKPKAASCLETISPIFRSSSGSKAAPRFTPDGKDVVSWIKAPQRPSMWKTAGMCRRLFSMTAVWSFRCHSAASSMLSQVRKPSVLIWPMPFLKNAAISFSLPLIENTPVSWAIFSSRVISLSRISALSRAVRLVSI